MSDKKKKSDKETDNPESVEKSTNQEGESVQPVAKEELPGAEEKKSAALASFSSMGEMDEIQKKVIFNSLQESISKYYALTSQKMYEKEEAFYR